MNVRISRRAVLSAGIAATTGLITELYGCGSGNGSTQSSSMGTNNGNGSNNDNNTIVTDRILLFNGLLSSSGGASSLSFSAKSTVLSTGNVVYGQLGNAGVTVNVQVGDTAFTCGGPGIPTLSTTGTLNGKDLLYTLVAMGEVGLTGTLRPQLALVSSSTAIAVPIGNNAAFRIINLSLNPDAIGVYVVNQGVIGSPLVQVYTQTDFGVSYRNSHWPASIPPMGSLAIVDSKAPDVAINQDTFGNLNNFPFAPNKAYTLYVVGQSGNSAQPISGVWVEDFQTGGGPGVE